MKKKYVAPRATTLLLHESVMLAQSDASSAQLDLGNDSEELETEEQEYGEIEYKGIFGD